MIFLFLHIRAYFFFHCTPSDRTDRKNLFRFLYNGFLFKSVVCVRVYVLKWTKATFISVYIMTRFLSYLIVKEHSTEEGDRVIPLGIFAGQILFLKFKVRF